MSYAGEKSLKSLVYFFSTDKDNGLDFDLRL